MSDTTGLQFDRAEYGGSRGTVVCAFCKGEIPSSYFQINAQISCEACRYRLDSAAEGSSIGRFLRALALGGGAAAAGAILYYAISAITGYEFGLIAILVGFGVGAAVRKGSSGRGGWRYQTLAMALTYLAIVATYIPPIVKAIREHPSKPAAAGSATPGVMPAADTSEAPAREPVRQITFGQFMLGVTLLVALACAAPFLAGIQNIMGIIIIGIGLYEAWKLNRRIPLVITGPHAISAGAHASA